MEQKYSLRAENIMDTVCCRPVSVKNAGFWQVLKGLAGFSKNLLVRDADEKIVRR